MPELTYADRDTCQLPDLIKDDKVLPPGSTFACPHHAWTVTWTQAWGGTAQPAWVCTTVAAPSALQVDLELPQTGLL